jgi:competence protein ComEA
MNPFLHDTVARPTATSGGTSLPPSDRPSAGAPPAASPIASPGVSGRVLSPSVRRFVRLARKVALAAGMAMAAIVPAHAVDVNVATQTELEGVRGVGPKTAETIVRERQKGGAFKSFEDFSGRVRGIGAKRAQKLKDAGLSVGAATTATAAAPATSAANASRNTPRPVGGKPN